MKFWLLMAATLAFDWLGVTLAKKYVITEEWFHLAGAVLCFAMLAVAMIQLFRIENMAVANAIWAGLSIVGLTLVGIFYFKESISPVQILGIVFIIGGVILLELPR